MSISAEGAAGLAAEVLALEGREAWVIGTVQVAGVLVLPVQ